MAKQQGLSRSRDRVILHFDYDCFYASVVENENPALKSLPLAIQQKQIVVTCNYEARKRGLYKMQLISEAKRVCPEAIIILGEDLTRFRNASKDLYNFLSEFVWSHKAERLGFDEVWVDCTDMIEYNLGLLNRNDLANSFFCLDRDDPTIGFNFDANVVFGPTYPADVMVGPENEKLIIGSHLARYLRHQIESQKGYTSTVGISTNKILSKLVGNLNKPKNQTTLIHNDAADGPNDNVITFMDSHDIGKIPGIGFKLSRKIKEYVLGRAPQLYEGLVYGGTKEMVSVRDVRLYSDMGPEVLERILGASGSQKGIGHRAWNLIHGVDEDNVAPVKKIPSQISQEDSYMKYIHTFEDVKKQLQLLAKRLIERMRIDLTEKDSFDNENVSRRWLAHPRTLRLSTRPRPAIDADGMRPRTFQRISRSVPLPNFVFNLHEAMESLANKLVEETLLPMFRRLHPDKTGWNLSLINVAVTNIAETGGESKDSKGRDIGRMFKMQDEVLREFQVTVEDESASVPCEAEFDLDRVHAQSPKEIELPKVVSEADGWFSEGFSEEAFEECLRCHINIPAFAVAAHYRYHDLEP